MPTTPNTDTTPLSLEAELASLLNDLLAGQGELMAVLNRKRNLLGAMDHEGLAAVTDDEERMLGVLQNCLARRQTLLDRAAREGLPARSIQSLTNALPAAQRAPLARQVTAASSRARLLQTQSLTNWIVIQRTLIHLSQLLEIIATGGRIPPTYGRAGSSRASGALLNREA
jgi:flagellar biosynthesis/type III secretory pathway chaperone